MYVCLCVCIEDYDRIISQLNNTVIDADDQHQCFLGVAVTLARDKNIQQAISDIHRMTHPFLNPQFLDEADAASSVTELLSRDFVRELGVTLPDDGEEEGEVAERGNTLALKDTVKKAMVSAEFDSETVDQLLSHLFEDSVDGTSFHCAAKYANSNARNAGFKSFIDLHRQVTTGDCFDDRLRLYAFQYSIDQLIELTKVNRHLLSDDPAHFYRSLLAQFCRAQGPQAARGGPTTTSTTDSFSRINTIAAKTRRNAVRLLTHQPKILTLNEWACQGSTFLHRIVSRKTISKVINAANKTELGLHQLEVFTCYLCPSTGSGPSLDEEDDIHAAFRPLSSNTNASLRHANLYRFVAHDGAAKVFEHIQEAHSKGFVGDKCYLTIPCRSCIQGHILKPSESSLRLAWVCCADCGLDHQTLCHADSDRLMALYSSLAPEFSNDLRATEIIKKYLFSRCFACGDFFDNYKELTNHQKACFASFACQSSGYGKPLTTAAFFSNNFLRIKEDEAAKSHALEQLAKLVEELRAETTPRAAALLSLRGDKTLSEFPSSSNKKGKGKNGSGGKTKNLKEGQKKSNSVLNHHLPAAAEKRGLSATTHPYPPPTKQHVEMTQNNDYASNDNDGISIIPIIRRVDTTSSSAVNNALPHHRRRHHDDDDDVDDKPLDAEERVWLEAEHAQWSALRQEPFEEAATTPGGSPVRRDATAISLEECSLWWDDDNNDDDDPDPPLKKKKQ